MSEIINVQHLDGQLLVTSLELAKNFCKDHKHILEKIDSKRKELNKSVDNSADINNLKLFFLDNFLEDSYIDSKGREQRQILLTRDGFSFITMGFTGIKADAWKLKYIEAFNKMESELRNPFSNMSKELQAIFAIDKKQKETEKKVDKLYNIMTIDYSQQENIRVEANRKAVEVLGGKDKLAYKRLNRSVFQAMWRDYKSYFKVNSYKNTATKDYDKAIDYIERWQPNTNLILAIEELNNQLAFA